MLLSPSTLAIAATVLRPAFAQITLAPRQVNTLAAAEACTSAQDIVFGCVEQTPTFILLPFQSRASCVCTSYTGFDNNINTCLAFLSGQPFYAYDYSTALPYASLCARYGGGGSAATTTAVTNAAPAISTTFVTSSPSVVFFPLQTSSSSGGASGTYYPAAKSKGSRKGGKAGGIVGGVLGALALVVIGFLAKYFKDKKKGDEQPSTSAAGVVPNGTVDGNPNNMGGNPNMTGFHQPTYNQAVYTGAGVGAGAGAGAEGAGGVTSPVSPLTTELSGTASLKASEMTATVTPVYELGTTPAPPPAHIP